MSALVTCTTNMKDEKAIVNALVRMGVPQSEIEIGDSIKLNGYDKQTADVNICVRKSFHGGYSDVGFTRKSSGVYDIMVDDMDDVGRLAVRCGVKNFSSSVKQWYSALKTQRALKNQGLSVKINRDQDKLVVVGVG